METVWRVTAADIDAVRHGDQRAVEEMLRMLDALARAGGEYVIRCTFPGPYSGGGFEWVVRRWTRSWLSWVLWWWVALPLEPRL